MADKRSEVRSIISEYNSERTGAGRFGIIQSYDERTNSATVILSSPDSDAPSDIITDVMCPVILGVQTVAPSPGQPCWIVFKGQRNDKRAVVSHYFNHSFERFNYHKQYSTESSVPRFMLGL